MKVTEEFLNNISVCECDILPNQKQFLLANGFKNPLVNRGWRQYLLDKEIPDDIAKQLLTFRYNYSLSHSKVQHSLKKTLKTDKAAKGKKYNKPMADFRHGIYLVCDKCKSLREITFDLDYEKELTIAYLVFPYGSFRCTYNYKGTPEEEVYIEKLNTVNESEQDLVVTVANTHCNSKDMWQYVKSFEPKKKVVIKKKPAPIGLK